MRDVFPIGETKTRDTSAGEGGGVVMKPAGGGITPDGKLVGVG